MTLSHTEDLRVLGHVAGGGGNVPVNNALLSELGITRLLSFYMTVEHTDKSIIHYELLLQTRSTHRNLVSRT